MNEETKAESLLYGDFSCETTEDLYEPTDDEVMANFVAQKIENGEIEP